MKKVLIALSLSLLFVAPTFSGNDFQVVHASENPYVYCFEYEDNGQIYQVDQSVQLTDSATFTATWNKLPDRVVLTLDETGGEPVEDITTARVGDVIGLPLEVNREGYVLLGWSEAKVSDYAKDAEVVSSYYNSALPYTVTESKTLYAVWQAAPADVNVSFNANGGEGSMEGFVSKEGEVIAAPCVTAIDDGTMPNEWGSLNIDDEGTPTTRLVLIENGILKNYMIDKLNARKMGMPITGSSRRQGYMFAPTSRMRNTYIAAGDDDEAEIISSMGDGLYAKAMGGGSVEPSTGKFNFSVQEGYLVKDGKIAHPVRGASLIGRGSEILPLIDRVGKDMQMAQGMCGSMSGSVPTNVGQPMIRVSSMTVGGR